MNVIPVKTGIQGMSGEELDSGFRQNDTKEAVTLYRGVRNG